MVAPACGGRDACAWFVPRLGPDVQGIAGGRGGLCGLALASTYLSAGGVNLRIGRDPEETCERWVSRAAPPAAPVAEEPPPAEVRPPMLSNAPTRGELAYCAQYGTSPRRVRVHLARLIAEAGGDRYRAAASLGISYSWLAAVAAGSGGVGPRLLAKLYPDGKAPR